MKIVRYRGKEYGVWDILDNHDEHEIWYDKEYLLLPLEKITFDRHMSIQEIEKIIVPLIVESSKLPFIEVDENSELIKVEECYKFTPVVKHKCILISVETTTNNKSVKFTGDRLSDELTEEIIFDILASKGYCFDDEQLVSLSASIQYEDSIGDSILVDVLKINY